MAHGTRIVILEPHVAYNIRISPQVIVISFNYALQPSPHHHQSMVVCIGLCRIPSHIAFSSICFACDRAQDARTDSIVAIGRFWHTQPSTDKNYL